MVRRIAISVLTLAVLVSQHVAAFARLHTAHEMMAHGSESTELHLHVNGHGHDGHSHHEPVEHGHHDHRHVNEGEVSHSHADVQPGLHAAATTSHDDDTINLGQVTLDILVESNRNGAIDWYCLDGLGLDCVECVVYKPATSIDGRELPLIANSCPLYLRARSLRL